MNQSQHGHLPYPAASKRPRRWFGNGVWEVGVDVAAGKFKSTGPDGSVGSSCDAARLKTGDGSFGDIIDQDVSQGPVTITIEESEYFDSTGCADWVKAD